MRDSEILNLPKVLLTKCSDIVNTISSVDHTMAVGTKNRKVANWVERYLSAYQIGYWGEMMSLDIICIDSTVVFIVAKSAGFASKPLALLYFSREPLVALNSLVGSNSR